MKRRTEGRSVPLENLIEEFKAKYPEPPATEYDSDAHREWSKALYAHAAEHGYNSLEVIRAGVYRQMNPRPAPSMKRRRR